MKVLILGAPLKFTCVPRKYPIVSDALALVLRHENTETILTPTITFTTAEMLTVTITDTIPQFKAQTKFEIELKIEEETIYKGKLIVLEEGTDIQNYQYDSQSTGRFQFNE